MIKLGLIGAGRWGRNYIRTLTEMQGVELALVASSNPETASLVPAGCQVVPDWQAVVQSQDIQGVVIATPPATHAEIAKAAIEAGLAVLVEKPLTLSMAEALELKRLATEKNCFVMVDHTHLFNPAYRSMHELTEHLGRLQALWGQAGAQGPYRKDADVLWDWGSHDIAMCLDMTGLMPEEVRAHLVQDTKIEGGIGQSVEIGLWFPGDIEARIELSNLLVEKRRRFTAYYELATLVFDDLAPTKLTLYPPAEPFTKPDDIGEAIDIADVKPLDLVVREFTDGIRFGQWDLGTLSLAVPVTAVLEEAQKRIKAS